MSKYEQFWNYIKNCGNDVITLTFTEIGNIAGVPIDHSFLRYKNELAQYGYKVRKISTKEQKVTFEKMLNNTLVLYIHGKGGMAEESEHYKPLFPDYDVVGLNFRAKTPWEAKLEFPAAFQTLSAGYNNIILITNSIGAYFSMCTLPQERLKRSYFISPIVDMEKVIYNMIDWANVSDTELQEKGTIETAFGETLSWKYLCYVRSHPIRWNVPTHILYGGQDHLTDRKTITDFANSHQAELTIMENGEHWFHTTEQMKYLDNWIIRCESESTFSHLRCIRKRL